MYYKSEGARDWRVALNSLLPMPPSVALRRLWEQLDSYRKPAANDGSIDIYRHFEGPISPPLRTAYGPIGDPVFEAVASYTSVLLARAGHLTARQGISEEERLDIHGKLTRSLFAAEHALAIDLGKVAPTLGLQAREHAARATLALAAFWLDRPFLLRLHSPQAHPLLGVCPPDAFGQTLYAHAETALRPPKQPVSPGMRGQDSGISRYISPAA